VPASSSAAAWCPAARAMPQHSERWGGAEPPSRCPDSLPDPCGCSMNNAHGEALGIAQPHIYILPHFFFFNQTVIKVTKDAEPQACAFRKHARFPGAGGGQGCPMQGCEGQRTALQMSSCLQTAVLLAVCFTAQNKGQLEASPQSSQGMGTVPAARERLASPASPRLWLPAWGMQNGHSPTLGVLPCFALPSAGIVPLHRATPASQPAGPRCC